MFTAFPPNPLPMRENWLIVSGMSGDRIARAVARIQSAAGRIEAAAPHVSAPDAELSRKYDALREETTRALTELDQLIGQFDR